MIIIEPVTAESLAAQGITIPDLTATPTARATSALAKGSPRPMFEAHPPSFFTNYEIPEDAILLGDCHMTRGNFVVIGGVPGCGKSRLLLSLAIAGRQGPGATWMGMPVHSHFKTVIFQAENGEVRLKRELQDIASQGHDLDGWLHITPPPRFGLAFNSPEFRKQVRDWLAEHKPGVFAIDPWNRCTLDDKAKDFTAVIEGIGEVLPDGPDKPAVMIVHHMRKRGAGEPRRHGRDLLPELSGATIIGSTCRAAFFLEPATPDGSDDRVVFTCGKNNDGELGPPTAWHRRNGLFAPCDDFDWDEWEEGGTAKRRGVELEDLAAVFENGAKTLSRTELVKILEDDYGMKRSSAYYAVKPGGRFDAHLSETGGFLMFKP